MAHKAFDMEEIMEIEHAMGRNTKKPVDQNAPKRPMSAYFLWANKVRNSVVKENPDASLGEIGKKLGALWKNVSESDRSPFAAKAEKERSAYEKKKEKYIKTAQWKKHQKMIHAWKIHTTKKPYPKDINAPKRGLSAYMLYAESVRKKIVEENPDMSSPEIMKEQSVWWKALSEKDRKPFVEKAASEKAKHAKRLERYMKTADYQKWSKGKEEYKQEMKDKRNKLMGVKKKRARSKVKGKSPSKKKQKKQKSKSRSVSRRRRGSRRSKTPKASKSRSTSKRRARTPKGAKKKSRSMSRSRSASRSVSSRSASSSRKSKSPSRKRKPGRRKEKSRRKSKKRSAGRRARKAKKRTKKTKSTDSDVAE